MVKIFENVPLAPLTTLAVGGPARFFCNAEIESDVSSAFEFADEHLLPVFILAGGSNVLISDGGFEGLVIHIALKELLDHRAEVEVAGSSPLKRRLISAAAGESWDNFVEYCVCNGLAGVECLSGIPGSVGGTPVQNVGAYGQDVSETIVSVRCFDRQSRKVVELSNEQCKFEYRRSIFNSEQRDAYVVLSVTYSLIEDGKPRIVYRDLENHFAGTEPTLAETRAAVLSIRRSKSMVIDNNDPNRQSAGSFFKNPTISMTQFNELEAAWPDIPQYPVQEGRVKVSAAWLIENSGFHKGFVIGNVGISTNHTLAIINKGNATATEIIGLMSAIQLAVAANFGIDLVPEPVFIGKF